MQDSLFVIQLSFHENHIANPKYVKKERAMSYRLERSLTHPTTMHYHPGLGGPAEPRAVFQNRSATLALGDQQSQGEALQNRSGVKLNYMSCRLAYASFNFWAPILRRPAGYAPAARARLTDFPCTTREPHALSCRCVGENPGHDCFKVHKSSRFVRIAILF